MSDSHSFKEVLKCLHSNDINSVHSALVAIRKNYSNPPERMKQIEKYHVLKIVISYMEHPKICDVSLSIIANCCLDDDLRQTVIKNGGIECLMRILKGLVNEKIINRVCRAVGNIALSTEGAIAVHRHKPVPHIVQFLTDTEDVNCQQTAVRTLRILGNNCTRCEIIVQANGILPIAKLLRSDDTNVVRCSVKAITELTRRCSVGCAMQIQESDALSALVELYNNEDENVSNNALVSLANLTYQSVIRPQLVNVGAIKIFVEIINNSSAHGKTKSAILALCSCCTDSVERQGVRNTDSLKALLNVLQNDAFESVHVHIVSALISLYCEVLDFSIIHEVDLLTVLVRQLKKFVDVNKCEHPVKDVSETKIDDDVQEVLKESIISESEFSDNAVENSAENAHDDNVQSQHKIFPQCKTNFENSKDTQLSENSDSGTQFATSGRTHKFSIYSPSYQGIQNFGTSSFPHLSAGEYSSASSSLSTSPPSTSPNHYSFEYHPSSPASCSSTSGPWSPTTSSVGNSSVCWSPVVSPSNAFSSCSSESDDEEERRNNSKIVCEKSDKTFEKLEKTCETNVNLATNQNNDGISGTPSFLSNILSTEEKCNGKKSNSFGKCLDYPLNLDCVPASRGNFETNNINSCLLNKCGSVNSYAIKNVQSDSDKNQEICTNSPKRKFSNVSSDQTIEMSEGEVSQNKKLKYENHSPLKSCIDIKVINKSSDAKKKSIDYYLLILLSQLSIPFKTVANSEIAEKIHFGVLMDYLSQLPNPDPRAARILMRLISNHYSFEKLIMCDFVGQIYERMKSPHDAELCSRCNFLQITRNKLLFTGRLLCESEYGIGTLSHILLTGNSLAQLHSLQAISQLVCQKDILYKLLISADGLTILLEFLSESNFEVFKSASCSLSRICRSLVGTLSVRPKIIHPKLTCDKQNLFPHCKYQSCDLNVSFIVDGGFKVGASREKLSEKSTYFQAMLNGHFIEKTQTVISLPGVPHEGFILLLHFLHNCLESGCSTLHHISLDKALELLSLCDQFILFNVQKIIEKYILYDLKIDLAPAAYIASKKYNFLSLTSNILQFILCESDLTDTYFYSLQNLITSLSEEFINDIRQFIKDKFPGRWDKPLYKRRHSSISEVSD